MEGKNKCLICENAFKDVEVSEECILEFHNSKLHKHYEWKGLDIKEKRLRNLKRAFKFSEEVMR